MKQLQARFKSVFHVFCVIFVHVMIGMSICHSAIPVENDFDSDMEGFELFGDAIRLGSGIRLMPALSARQGSIFSTKSYPVSKFTASFDFRIGTKQTGTDRMTFAFVEAPGVGSGGHTSHPKLDYSFVIIMSSQH